MADKPKTPGPAPKTTPKNESATELTDAELAQISGGVPATNPPPPPPEKPRTLDWIELN
jgi:bacteriocin-like protein